jgi:hypothetical protein
MLRRGFLASLLAPILAPLMPKRATQFVVTAFDIQADRIVGFPFTETQEFAAFTETQMRAVAAAIDMSYEQLTAAMPEVSYLSIHLGDKKGGGRFYCKRARPTALASESVVPG